MARLGKNQILGMHANGKPQVKQLLIGIGPVLQGSLLAMSAKMHTA